MQKNVAKLTLQLLKNYAKTINALYLAVGKATKRKRADRSKENGTVNEEQRNKNLLCSRQLERLRISQHVLVLALCMTMDLITKDASYATTIKIIKWISDQRLAPHIGEKLKTKKVKQFHSQCCINSFLDDSTFVSDCAFSK